MSFADVLAEIPRFTAEQRRELLQRIHAVAPAAGGFSLEQNGGASFLVAPRVIRQARLTPSSPTFRDVAAGRLRAGRVAG